MILKPILKDYITVIFGTKAAACELIFMHSACSMAYIWARLKAVDTWLLLKIIISVKPFLVTSNGERLMV